MSGASQDELCLLGMVEKKGLARLLARDASTVTIEIMGEIETYDVMKVIEFTSDRKMMSVVMKNCDTGFIRVFAKGASDSVSTRLTKRDFGAVEASIDLTLANKFASEGLRVLSFGVREFTDENDITSITADKIETDLELVGITAVEDLLQDDVA